MIVNDLIEFPTPNIFARIRNFIRDDVALYLKLESFNPGGSIKFKPAVGLIRALETAGELGPGGQIIETTSGNMGIALSMVARSRGYGFVCVSDEKMTEHNRALVRAYGAELVVMPGSTLRERKAYISARLEENPQLIWTRQFENPINPATHAITTAEEILDELPQLDYLFVGTGTAGTLAGCARRLATHTKAVRLVAVDSHGSRHFSSATGSRRLFPGIGASEPSPFLSDIALNLHRVVVVHDVDAVAPCHELVQRTGWLLGASSGSVLSAIKRLEDGFRSGDVVVGIAADSGERYLDGLYDGDWLKENVPLIQDDLVSMLAE